MKLNPRQVLIAFVVVTLVAAGGWYTFQRPRAELTVTANFVAADGLFIGNNVDLLGIKVGTVTAVQPQGATVKVTMRLPADTKIPAAAHAYILAPDVVSDRYIELTPVYRGGPAMADGAAIPVERTHAPISWDKLMRTVDELLTTFGPSKTDPQGILGPALRDGAKILHGNGSKLRRAVQAINQASTVLVGDTPDATAALKSFNGLVSMLNRHQGSIDRLSRSVSALSDEFAGEQSTISDTVTQLAQALTQLSTLIHDNRAQLHGTVTDLAHFSTTLAGLRGKLANTLDVGPLAFQNVSRAVDGGQLRVRLNMSTQLQQFAAGKAACRVIPTPLCNGPGLNNPIPVPVPEALDPLGLTNFSGGGK
jgi:phospholipid/cholesterol/gamma-HCH transport system substrate-binding protein